MSVYHIKVHFELEVEMSPQGLEALILFDVLWERVCSGLVYDHSFARYMKRLTV